MEIILYQDRFFDGVKTLWEDVFPDDPPYNAAEAAIPAKMKAQPELFFLAVEGDQVTGTIMAGYDGHRGWLYAVAVVEDHRRSGIGRALVHHAERRLNAMGCGKINLQVRSSNARVVEFYERLGYVIEDRASMGKRV